MKAGHIPKAEAARRQAVVHALLEADELLTRLIANAIPWEHHRREQTRVLSVVRRAINKAAGKKVRPV